jgi:hypothetical protein
MTDAQIDSPIPIPLDSVVQKALPKPPLRQNAFDLSLYPHASPRLISGVSAGSLTADEFKLYSTV